MITITPYPEERVDLYAPDDQFIASVNQSEFLDARIQIYLGKMKGYYILTEFGRFDIDSSGSMQSFPPDLFRINVQLARKLMNLHQNDIANIQEYETTTSK